MLQNRLNGMEAGHAEDMARVVERHAKELLRLKGEIERQRQLAEQQEVLLAERHRAEAQGAEEEQRGLNDALMHKYETLLLRREQEAEARRLADVRALGEEHARQAEVAKGQWLREREEALREAREDGLRRAEEDQRALGALQAQLHAREAEAEQRRLEAVQASARLPRRRAPPTVAPPAWRTRRHPFLHVGPRIAKRQSLQHTCIGRNGFWWRARPGGLPRICRPGARPTWKTAAS